MNHEEFTSIWVPRTITAYNSLSTEQKTEFLSQLFETMGHQEKYYLQSTLPEFLHRDFVCLLPIEILEKILNCLKLEDLLVCCLVSKGWNKRLSSLDFIWKNQASNLGIKLISKGKFVV